MRVTGNGVDTCTNGCRTQVYLQEEIGNLVQAAHLLVKSNGKCFELLAKCHRHSILQLCTAHLYNVVELLAFCTENGNKTLQLAHKVLVMQNKTQLEGCGIGIVGRL